MKNYKKMKMITAFILAFMVALIGFPSVSSAATIGNQLTAPESSWQRIDDSHPFIGLTSSTGKWVRGTYSTVYNNTLLSGSGDAKLLLTFYGTKLRIIDPLNPNRSSAIQISIDGGPVETFSEYSSSPKSQILVYEKTGLPLGIHTVLITLDQADTMAMAFDAFDIDKTGYIIDSNVTAPTLTAAGAIKEIDLSWSTVSNATGYNIYRSLTPGGSYEQIATSVTESTYTDSNVTVGIKYYYVVTALNSVIEGNYSNEASATPIEDELGRGILTITLINGFEKEYDLSMKEVNDFINWYEAKQEGTGKASYAINKHDNNKGPFKSRKDYILFDRILTFEVSEY